MCEINPLEENFIKLINIVLDRKFKNIEEFVKYFYPEHIVKYIETDNTEKKIIIIDDKYKVTLDFEHSRIEDVNPKIRSRNLYELLFESFDKGLSYRNKLVLYEKLRKTNGDCLIHDLIKSKIGWDASVSLKKGLEITYKWIYSEIKSGSNTNKFITKY